MSKEKKNNSTSKKEKNKITKNTDELETKVTKRKESKKKEKIKTENKNKKEIILEEEVEKEEDNFIEESDEIEENDEILEDDNEEEHTEDENESEEDEEDNELEEDFQEEEEFVEEDEEFIQEDNETKMEEEIKPSKEKKENKKKKSEEKIKQIENLAKKKKKTSTHKKNSTSNFFSYLDKNRFTIYGFIGGVLLTVFIAIIIWPDRIATLKDGTQNVATIDGHNYTANDLYENMKDHYSVSMLLDEIDNDLLTKMYEEDDEMKKEVNSNAEYYLNMYNQYYGYTEEQFLSENGFSNYDAFLDYLRLDYRRNKYLDEYVEKNIEDKEIDKYYKDNVVGDINCQHILVETSSSEDDGKLSDEEAKKLAQEIIDKLNDGTSWEDVQKEYKDKITFEDLGYQAWDASLESTFMDALKALDDKSYSTEPVKTSYGYHVIYRLDQKETPKLEDVKEDIIEKIVTDKKSDDSNLLYKALINLRKENNLEFSDTVLKSKYDAYIKKYN